MVTAKCHVPYGLILLSTLITVDFKDVLPVTVKTVPRNASLCAPHNVDRKIRKATAAVCSLFVMLFI